MTGFHLAFSGFNFSPFRRRQIETNMAAEAGKTGLELLMTYTTFHIGVYVTLATAVIGADAFKNIGHWSLRFVALPCFAIAGLAGV